MSSPRNAEEACRGYLQPFFTKFNVKLMARMLIRPLTISLVEAALDTLKKTSSPGVDGIPYSLTNNSSMNSLVHMQEGWSMVPTVRKL